MALMTNPPTPPFPSHTGRLRDRTPPTATSGPRSRLRYGELDVRGEDEGPLWKQEPRNDDRNRGRFWGGRAGETLRRSEREYRRVSFVGRIDILVVRVVDLLGREHGNPVPASRQCRRPHAVPR